jgi:histidinol-phosphate aminotransferase
MLWLDKNENLDPELSAIIQSITTNLPSSSYSSYPEAALLYKKLANWVGVSPECLMLTPGSDGAIRLIFEAFVDDGDCVIHTNPTFAMYPIYAKMFGAKAITIDYKVGKNGPFLDINELVSLVHNKAPKLLCLPNPDSPTGSTLSPDALRKILTACEEIGTLLLIDEAYYPFYDWTAVPWIFDSSNLIVARTFSKAWGAAGIRMGYAIANSQIISLIHKMRPMYEVGSLNIAIIERLLDFSAAMEESVCRIQFSKQYFAEEMRKIGFDVLQCEGNFIHVAFGSRRIEIEEALKNKVLYKANFDHVSLRAYSRFSIGSKEEMAHVVALIKTAIIKD